MALPAVQQVSLMVKYWLPKYAINPENADVGHLFVIYSALNLRLCDKKNFELAAVPLKNYLCLQSKRT